MLGAVPSEIARKLGVGGKRLLERLGGLRGRAAVARDVRDLQRLCDAIASSMRKGSTASPFSAYSWKKRAMRW